MRAECQRPLNKPFLATLNDEGPLANQIKQHGARTLTVTGDIGMGRGPSQLRAVGTVEALGKTGSAFTNIWTCYKTFTFSKTFKCFVFDILG